MYKVFFNASAIKLESEIKKSPKSNNCQFVEIEEVGALVELVSEIEHANVSKNMIVINRQVDKLWNEFRSHFVDIQAAGGVVLNNENEILFIKRLGVWDLPKGKIELGEHPESAAIREVTEECGISNLKVNKKLNSTFHIYRSPWHNVPNNLVLKETHWFEMFYNGHERLVPQLEEHIEEVKWFSIDQLDVVLANMYSNLKELMYGYLKITK